MARKRRHLFTRSLPRRLALFCGILAGAFVLINYILLPAYVNHSGTLRVPRVVGLPLQDAMQVLRTHNLEPVEADSRPDPKHPPGTVVQQNPPSDAIVKGGRRVYLTTSGGEVLVPVPKLRGLSTRDSRFALERSRLHLGNVEYATSDTYPENTIISQTVPPGTKVSRGSAIGVTVSRGKVVLETLVPDLTGRTLAEAEKLLAARGLRTGNITSQPSFDLLPNTIVDQFPRAGESVSEGQAVDLFVVRAGRPRDEITPPRN